MRSNLFILFFITVLSLRTVYCISGCVPLDSFSFEKIVSKFNAALIKFDAAYPYGKKQDEYEKVCTASRNIDNLLVAEVAIKDYGEKDNADLAERFSIKKDDHPVVKLFVKDVKEPYTFKADTEDDFTEENLKSFIRSKSNVYIGLLGCLQEFDTIAENFSKEKNKDVRKKLLLEAEKIWDSVKGGQNQKSAEVYVKYMRKTLEVGDEFIGTETNRIKNIIKGKVSTNKKEELEQKINILKAFSMKDEL